MTLSMDRWRNRVAVVTGASSGIGEAIVRKLIDDGLQVVGLARNVEKMKTLAKGLKDKTGTFHSIKTDITKEADIFDAFKWIKDNLGSVYVLVNCAGIIRKTNLHAGDTKLWKEIFDTNCLGLCVATREAIGDMRANGVDGHIVHINSIGGHTVPNYEYLSVYSGSKWAVTALTETLRLELNSIGSKIKITSISPGSVHTELLANGEICEHSEIGDVYKHGAHLLPEDVSEAVAYVLSTPHHVQVHELIIRAIGEK